MRLMNMLTMQEAMDQLGVSRSTVDRWRKEKRLPSYKIGKEVYFDKTELAAWVKTFASADPFVRPAAASAGPLKVGFTAAAAQMWSPLLMRRLGLLESELRQHGGPVGVDVEWRRAENGMRLVQELVAGHVHIATFGDYAISLCGVIGRLLPAFRAVLLASDGKAADGKGFAIVVPPGLSVDYPSGLAELPISTTSRSNAEYRIQSMLAAIGIENARLLYEPVERAMERLAERSRIAAVLWEPYISIADYYRIGVPIGEWRGSGFTTGVVADESWARSNGDLVEAYLRAHLKAHRMLRSEPSTAARLLAEETGHPVDAVRRAIANVRWDAALYEADLQAFGRIDPHSPRGGARPTGGAPALRVDLRYLQEAVRRLRLPDIPAHPLPDAASATLY
ncbi:helix-turn-helix domain-containing protein [Paenibacillus flagellatus]|uniref:Helix-turn-helix domain-containing protein n=1 Tax=Paenibacillus flagellatus TaxID=2211139 RepID=A0A2V5K8Z5_9BACL|nr:helix-turn-helix domain-containing protein [Paenibacillus flagellatus]PYI54534.1 hypothetical protein DLM86_13815 [Paenibacillus flagellatus]